MLSEIYQLFFVITVLRICYIYSQFYAFAYGILVSLSGKFKHHFFYEAFSFSDLLHSQHLFVLQLNCLSFSIYLFHFNLPTQLRLWILTFSSPSMFLKLCNVCSNINVFYNSCICSSLDNDLFSFI